MLTANAPTTIVAMNFEDAFKNSTVDISDEDDNTVEGEYDDSFEADEGEFYCNICQQTFMNKREIDIKFHLENKHFLCNTCNKQFASSKDVRNHLWDVHATKDMLKKHS